MANLFHAPSMREVRPCKVRGRSNMGGLSSEGGSLGSGVLSVQSNGISAPPSAVLYGKKKGDGRLLHFHDLDHSIDSLNQSLEACGMCFKVERLADQLANKESLAISSKGRGSSGPPSALEITMRALNKALREIRSTSINGELLRFRLECPPTKLGENKSLRCKAPELPLLLDEQDPSTPRQECPPTKLGQTKSLRCETPELPLLLHEQDPCTPCTAVPLTPLQKFKQTTPHIQMIFVQEYLTVLNTAKREELLQLKGIGPKRVAHVLELREQRLDPFKDLEDLKNIGLGKRELLSEFAKTLM